MVTAYDAVLWPHVAAGFLALGAGGGAILTEKGGLIHRRCGRVFLYSMAVVSVTAIAVLGFGVTVFRVFLAMVAVFSFYFAFSGYRVLSRKRPGTEPDTIDRGSAGVFLLASAGIAGLGGWLLARGSSFAVVLLVFGAIGLAQGVRDLHGASGGPDEPRWWFYDHLARMSAAYIATVTAFSAVNFHFLPTVVRWLWPTAVGVPAIVLAQQRYRRRFGDGDGSEDAAA